MVAKICIIIRYIDEAAYLPATSLAEFVAIAKFFIWTTMKNYTTFIFSAQMDLSVDNIF